MSRPKHWWLGVVARAVRQYPKLREAEDLTRREREIRDAVAGAAAAMEETAEGREVMDCVRLTYWERGGETLETVGERLHLSRATVQRRNGTFLREAARRMGYGTRTRRRKS